MTYVSKEAAKALKEVGFDAQCYWHYAPDGDLYSGDYYNSPNKVGYASPTHLEAGDWFFPNHSMEFVFGIYRTKVFCHRTAEYIINEGATGGDPIHRDLAILEACKIIKERKSQPPPAEG